MIELMDEYKNDLEARVNKRLCDNAASVPDDVAVNVEAVSNREPADFTNSRMAVMMMCVDTATAKSGNDCNLVDVVREVVDVVRDVGDVAREVADVVRDVVDVVREVADVVRDVADVVRDVADVVRDVADVVREVVDVVRDVVDVVRDVADVVRDVVDVVRDAAMTVVDKVIVVAEASNSIVAAVDSNVSQPTLTPVENMMALARRVINKVYYMIQCDIDVHLKAHRSQFSLYFIV